MATILNTAPKPVRLAGIGLLGLVIFSLFTVLIHTTSQKSILGADFYTFWMAGRAMFIENANPYSQEVTDQIQLGKLGRLANPDEDQMAFAYPPYGLLAVLPTVFLPFDWASSVWLALNLTIFTALIFFQNPHVRSFLLSSFLFFPVFLNLVLGTFDILALSGIFVFWAVLVAQKRASSNLQILSGILLAWATMKPQFVWLVLGFCLLMAIRHKYFLLLKTFLGALTAFIILSFIFVPGWIPDWINQVQAYSQYVQSRPTISEFFLLFVSEQISLVLSGAGFILCLAVGGYLLMQWWQGRIHWLKPLAWLSMMTYLFHLHGIAYEQIIFIFPVMLWVALRGQWKSADILFFWGAGLALSWTVFILGMQITAIDRSPVLFNLIWAGWLLRKPGFQL